MKGSCPATVVILGLLAGCVADVALAINTGPEIVPPSEVSASWESRWVAPFVLVTRLCCPGEGATTVTWCSPSGLCTVTDSLRVDADPFPTYFVSSSQDADWIQGMYGDWTLDVTGSGPAGLASGDGRVFVQRLQDAGRSVGVRIYVRGSRATDIGPYQGRDVVGVRIGHDGCVAALFSRKSEGDAALAVVTGEDGRVEFQCDLPDARRAYPAPGGKGALIWTSEGVASFADGNGRVKPLGLDESLELEPWFSVWSFDSRHVLLASEKSQSYVYVDYSEGRLLWQIKALAPRGISRRRVIPFAGHVFQCGREFVADEGERGATVGVIRMYSGTTGEEEATWRSSPLPGQPLWKDPGGFALRDQRLYYMTDGEFCELRPEDMVSPSGPVGEWSLDVNGEK